MTKPASNDLLKFLFVDSQKDAELDAYLELLSEEANREEDLKSKKSPLEKALKSVEIPTGGLEIDPVRGYVITFDSSDDYKKAKTALKSPEGMHAMAELGWLAADMGDQEGTEASDKFQMNFIEIAGANEEPSDVEKAADLEKSEMEKVAKDSFDFVNGDIEDREDEKPSQDKGKGVGDAKDGKDPEGKPKGTAKSESVVTEALKIARRRRP